MTLLGRLASLHLYPVKSARGLAVSAAEPAAFGLTDDRGGRLQAADPVEAA